MVGSSPRQPLAAQGSRSSFYLQDYLKPRAHQNQYRSDLSPNLDDNPVYGVLDPSCHVVKTKIDCSPVKKESPTPSISFFHISHPSDSSPGSHFLHRSTPTPAPGHPLVLHLLQALETRSSAALASRRTEKASTAIVSPNSETRARFWHRSVRSPPPLSRRLNIVISRTGVVMVCRSVLV